MGLRGSKGCYHTGGGLGGAATSPRGRLLDEQGAPDPEGPVTRPLLELLEAMRGSEPGAAEEWVRAVTPIVRAIVERRMRGRPEVESWTEDVVQDALLRLWRGHRQVSAGSELEAIVWTRTVTERIVATWMRERLVGIRATVRLSPILATLADDGDPIGAGLRQAYEALPEETQRLIYLRLVEGQSWEEIARAVDSTPSGARRRWQRAQARLRRESRRGEEDPDEES